ncbi:MAG TPA: glycosyltransferase family 4 protein [Geobacteraceae bacterium]|nr:glycosyltransferase family 4 protein [Geobacteraceae bacterium]
MKILYLNGADVEGGAAKAATRLLRGVHGLGAEARLLVQRKSGGDPLVDGPGSLFGKAYGFARPTVEQQLLGLKPQTMGGPFCAAYLPDGLARQVAFHSPDLIHLHWVARMIRLETVARFGVPLVWTMHDSWAFTGGCYLPGDCSRYRQSCGKCPVLNSSSEDDLSRRIWQRKKDAWHGLNLTVVAPSRWMAECARSSALFRDVRVEVIPNGIDTDRFTPLDRRTARDALSLPHDRKLILFGARGGTSDRNKGFHLLVEALRQLASMPGHDRTELLVFGSTEPAVAQECGFKTHFLGWQQDETSLALLYAAADVFVFPSLQESLGYTAMEAMACGTPCVAFRQGGVADLIDHGHNGYLARPFEADDLAQGIASILEDDALRQEWSIRARHKVVQKFSLERVAADHLALYRGILANGR